MNDTQENLYALATKVGHWSKEAASLAADLKEEALLLELSSQADKLAAAEARRSELHRREHVTRLGRENSVLRDELRDMICLCSLLLEREREPPRVGPAGEWPQEGPAAGVARSARWRATHPPPPPPPGAADAADAAGVAPGRRVHFGRAGYGYGDGYGGGELPAAAFAPVAARDLRPAARARAGDAYAPQSAARAADYAAGNLQYARTSYRPVDGYSVMPGPNGSAQWYRGSGDAGLYAEEEEEEEEGADAVGGEAGGFAGDAGAAAAAAADADAGVEVDAEAGAEADASGTDAWPPSGEVEADADAEGEEAEEEAAAAAEAQGAAGFGLEEGVEAGEDEAEDEERDLDAAVDRGHHQVAAALAALDEALGEITLHVPGQEEEEEVAGGDDPGLGNLESTAALLDGAEGYDADGGVSGYQEGVEVSTGTANTFAGFPQSHEQSQGGEIQQATPEMPQRWRRPAHGPGPGPGDSDEEAHTGSGSGAEEGAAAAAEQVEDVVIEPPLVRTPDGTPAKLAAGGPASTPATPMYQGVSRGDPYTAPATIRRAYAPPSLAANAASIAVASAAAAAAQHGTAAAATAAAAFGAPRSSAAAGLDALLLAEVEKLKQVNRALAATLQSYNRVSDRLGAAASASGGTAATAASTPPPLAGSAAPAPATARALFGPGWAPSAAGSAAQPAVDYYAPTSYAAARPRSAADATSTVPAPRVYAAAAATARPATAKPAAGSLLGEVRRLDSRLDLDLSGIRRELAALRHDMAADRLAAAAASAAGGTPGLTAAAALAGSPPVPAPTGLGVEARLRVPPPPPSPPPELRTSLRRDADADADAAEVGRLRDEVSELRRQLQLDRRWYFDSLDAVVCERSAMFEQLQRRLDRLAAWA